ncbi:indole-3-glycerol phosphate synthase [Seinonella peptonophila]|uniref:Indole-3-glycerol phosphate synthase n=1 Tax=Seinonella peptonophila TaxID=112248 RepID=A0A1M4TF10_9BACL|nr:indole-3-glycerol phosphate synthase TrpC [Seinonella peptonophila]SHE43070.1 indole-3-glycerol phosphate synthase [Seinonella peptonophila]
MFLKKIVATKQKEIDILKQKGQQDHVLSLAKNTPRSLSAALLATSFGIIAEIKPASPSKGVIQAEIDPITIATEYERGGAIAISVLTDRTYFQGSAENLINVRASVGLPVLRKDFIIDAIQIEESLQMGADAILLIVAILEEKQLKDLVQHAHQLGLEVLVEVHDEQELKAALSCEADVIGINNRNLHSFETNLETTERLLPMISSAQPVIAESGIHAPADALRMKNAGAAGILVGEYLMRQTNREQAIQALLSEV